MEHLFCPYCNNEDTVSLDDMQPCVHCGHVYSVAEQLKNLSEERLGLRFSSSMELPKTNKINLKPTKAGWEIKIKSKDGRVSYESELPQEVIWGLAVASIVAIFVLTRDDVNPSVNLFAIATLIFGFSVLLYFGIKFLFGKNLGMGADVYKFSFKNNQLTWTKNGMPSLIYGIETDSIYYELDGDNSKVRMKALDTKKFDEVLANHLSPAEARWLALFLKESLKREDIGRPSS